MTAPLLSVVVPSVNGWGDLEGCLLALERERERLPIEVLVPERCGGEVRASIAGRFAWAEVLPVPHEVSIPDMRALAFDRARAPSVAVIEDHVLVPEGWADAMLEARRDAEVVGGGVRNAATERVVDWAAFLCEYSHMLPPLPTGPHPWITGNNTVYSRELLQRFRDVTHAGRWEVHLHDALQAAGVQLIFRPDIPVDHKKHYTVWEYTSQRYLYARSYAGLRMRESSTGRRWLFRLGSPAGYPILLWRTVSRSLGKRVDRSLVWRSLPLTILFVAAWTAGDVMGSWFGSGRALSRVC